MGGGWGRGAKACTQSVLMATPLQRYGAARTRAHAQTQTHADAQAQT